jgi:hypothetical protein
LAILGQRGFLLFSKSSFIQFIHYAHFRPFPLAVVSLKSIFAVH